MFKNSIRVLGFLMTTVCLASTLTAHDGDDPHRSLDDIQWLKGTEGVSFGLLWGDWDRGPFGMIVKIEAGHFIPRHAHTHDYDAVTIQGNWIHIYEDGSEVSCPPGSHAFQKAYAFHGDRCEGEVDCLVLVHQHGPRSFILPTKGAEMTPKEIVRQTAKTLFVDFDGAAAEKLLAPDYIQHNPNVPTGAEALIGFLPNLEETGLKVTTHRVISDGSFVVMHNEFENAHAFGAPHLVAFDVFRVENGKVAEHWDNLQAPPVNTASGRSMTDGPTEIVDHDKTKENKAIVAGFLNEVFLEGKLDKASEYIISEPGAYHQHNPVVADGIDQLMDAFTMMAQAGQGFSFSKVHHIIAEGNFVFSMTEGKVGRTHSAFFDLWRVDEGKIVEHWDVISEIPATMAHQNGKF